MKTFDEKDIQSITNFRGDFQDFSETDEEFYIFNFTKAVNELKLVTDNIKDTRTKELLWLIQRMAFCYESEIVSKCILEIGLISLYETFLNNCLKPETFKVIMESKDYDLLKAVIDGLCSFVNRSDLLSTEITNCNIHKKVVEIANMGDFLTQEKVRENDTLDFYDTIILFLYHQSRFGTINTKDALLESGTNNFIVNELSKLNELISYRLELKYIKVSMTMALAYLLNESQMNVLSITDDIISTAIDTFKETLEKAKTNQFVWQRTKYFATYYINADAYYNASGCINHLIKLSINDEIKQKLYDAKILELLEELLDKGNDIEKENTCQLIGSLCFNRNVQIYLKERDNYMQRIRNIMESTESAYNKRYCEQIIDMVNQNLEKRIRSANIKKLESLKNGHIMISYNRKYKELCLKLNEQLKQNSYKTWIDEENVILDLRDTLAKAVESASVVLICYSEDYKSSINCRYEAEYAATLKKNVIAVRAQESYNPDGWLGLILASKFYVDISKKDCDIVAVTKNLIKQIEFIFNNTESAQPSYVRPPSARVASAKPTTNPAKWNFGEVKSYLITNNLPKMSLLFAKFNGLALKGLWEMKEKDYKQYCDLIEELIKSSGVVVDPIEKLSFNGLLSTVFS